MKKLTGMLSAAMALAVLAGCTAYNRAEDYITQPVVKDVKKGMTHEQVRRIAGAPSTEVPLVNARGTCQNYLLSERHGKPQNYFVSFNDAGRVMNYGFKTCNEYDTNPQTGQ